MQLLAGKRLCYRLERCHPGWAQAQPLNRKMQWSAGLNTRSKKKAKKQKVDEALYRLLLQIKPQHKRKHGFADIYSWKDILEALPADSASRFTHPFGLKRSLLVLKAAR